MCGRTHSKLSAGQICSSLKISVKKFPELDDYKPIQNCFLGMELPSGWRCLFEHASCGRDWSNEGAESILGIRSSYDESLPVQRPWESTLHPLSVSFIFPITVLVVV